MARKKRPEREEPKIPEYILTPIEEAARAGDLEKVKQLYEVDPNQQATLDRILHYACDGGQLDVVKYAQSIGAELYSNLYRSASWDGHLHIIKYLREQALDWGSSQFVETLCYYGHLPCIEFVLEQGCEWPRQGTSLAAKNGHISILKYAHEHGYRIDPNTMDDASYHGHLDCLQYAHKHNFPIGYNIAERAAEKGHIDCLRYRFENNIGWSNNDHIVIMNCILFDHLSALQVCYEYIEPTTYHLNFALKVQNYDFATYIFALLQSKNLLDTKYMIKNLNAITQEGSYMYYAHFEPVEVPFDEIKDDMLLRSLCYYIDDAYQATTSEEKVKMILQRHDTLASLLHLILEWTDLYRQEQDARYKVLSAEIKEIPQDIMKHCMYHYI